MAIPESQLDTWSHQGSVAQSANTYSTLKSVLEASTTPYAAKNFSVFLQGSYGNDTNIYAESDVDIVIRLDDCFQSDLSKLTEEEKAAYRAAFSDATYTHVDFKRDVLATLKAQYGSAVKAGDKAIAIDASGARRKADVIVAIRVLSGSLQLFRNFGMFPGRIPSHHRRSRSSEWALSYPVC